MRKIRLEVTVVVGDGHDGPIDLADLGSAFRIEELDLEVFVLFEFHVVDDRNSDDLLGLDRGKKTTKAFSSFGPPKGPHRGGYGADWRSH